MTVSTLQEFGALHLSRPSANASVATIAAWHERRAAVLDHLAAEGDPIAHDLAVSAHHHAADLLTGGIR